VTVGVSQLGLFARAPHPFHIDLDDLLTPDGRLTSRGMALISVVVRRSFRHRSLMFMVEHLGR
jgi:hypothetical protein